MPHGFSPTSPPSGILIYPAAWPQYMGRKLEEGYCVQLLWGVGSPSNTMWPGKRPIAVSSFILIHPTVWPQYKNVTDTQTRQRDRETDRQTDTHTDRQRSYNIGRTVLQTVAQKPVSCLRPKPDFQFWNSHRPSFILFDMHLARQ